MPHPAPIVPRFYPGEPAPAAPKQRPRRRRRVLGWLLRWSIIAGIWGGLALAVLVLWFCRDLPRPESALDAVRRPSLTLEDRSGHVIATYGDVVGEPLRLNQFPPALPAAVVAVEDRRFYHHPGIDPVGMARALWVNLTAGRVVQGGSTLTQQVAKTLFLTNARTVGRKVQELFLTLWLERHFTKNEILEIYLNRVYLGSGAWGMDAAAQIVFAPNPSSPGWFADWIAEKSETMLAPNTDATLRTTLDARDQAVAESRLAALLVGAGAAENVSQGAVVILDAATGAVRAMVGGRNYHDSPYNRAVLARRQPGSSFKPFVWLTALENGMTPDDTVLDGPIAIGNWHPVNFERRFFGDVTLEEALAQSLNTASVRLLLRSGGPRAVAATAARLGIADKLPNNASLALGTGEVGLLELTAAYAPFFNGGRRVVPFGLDRMAVPAEPVIAPEEAGMMARMLAAVVNRGTGRAAAVPGRLVAGKTGTTQDSRDAWFIGFVHNDLIGIWLGNDDNQPMRNVMGGSLPARLFHDIAIAID